MVEEASVESAKRSSDDGGRPAGRGAREAEPRLRALPGTPGRRPPPELARRSPSGGEACRERPRARTQEPSGTRRGKMGGTAVAPRPIGTRGICFHGEEGPEDGSGYRAFP